MLFLLACASAPDAVVGARLDDAPIVTSRNPEDRVTIEGRVFYNDRRNDGLFSLRDAPDGAPGEKCGVDGVRADGSACDDNELAASYAEVEASGDCEGTAIVGATGDFEMDLDCTGDIVLTVRLRYCKETCFSVGTEDETYALYHPDARPADPLTVGARTRYTLPDMGFRPRDSEADDPTAPALAANYFASAVDTIRTVHDSGDIPFYLDEFGELRFVYPSEQTNSATTFTPSEVGIVERDEWAKGEVVAHEYGHVLNLRAWDGDYGWDAIGRKWSVHSEVDPRLAFKEGWGNFVSRVVFTESGTCETANFDDNDAHPLPGEGEGWVTNVNKALCDWYDDRDDGGDTISSDFPSMWRTLRDMGIEGVDGGRSLCDWVAAANQDPAAVEDLLANNGVSCP